MDGGIVGRVLQPSLTVPVVCRQPGVDVGERLNESFRVACRQAGGCRRLGA